MNMNSSKEKEKDNNSTNFHTLTFQFDFSKINTDIKYVYFAYCYPYTYTQLTNYLFSLNNYKKILRIDSIGQTLDNNKLYMLIITNFEDSFDTLANKKAIIFTARVHPGESSSSFVIQGLIEFLLSNEPKAINLRKNYNFSNVLTRRYESYHKKLKEAIKNNKITDSITSIHTDAVKVKEFGLEKHLVYDAIFS